MSGGPSLGLFAPDIEQRDLELEVAHCVRGVMGEPCGVPAPVSVTTPPSKIPARSQLRSSLTISRSATRRSN